MKIKDILDYLCAQYPLDTACDFDNVGLLVGDENPDTDSALVCLDCDMTAVNRAKQLNCGLIITHHPVIFEGVRQLSFDGVLAELIRCGISVISMHTNLDVADDGVTATLCRVLDLKGAAPFETGDGFKIYAAQTEIQSPDSFAEHIKARLGGGVRYTSGRPLKNLLICSGSGGNYVSDAQSFGFDGLVTADVKHHQFIDAANAGISVFDAGHFDTENIIVKPLAQKLSAKFPQVTFHPYEPRLIKNI